MVCFQFIWIHIQTFPFKAKCHFLLVRQPSRRNVLISQIYICFRDIWMSCRDIALINSYLKAEKVFVCLSFLCDWNEDGLGCQKPYGNVQGVTGKFDIQKLTHSSIIANEWIHHLKFIIFFCVHVRGSN